MLDTIWAFFKSNREAVSALGGAVVVIVGGAWALFKYFDARKEATADTPTSQTIRADRGGVAIGRDAQNSPINTGTSAPPKR